MFKKKQRTYKIKKKKSQTRKSKPSSSSSPYQILKSDYKDLPSWYKEGLPKLKQTVKHRYKPIVYKNPMRKSPSPEDIKFRDVLYPAWVGKVPYPKIVDLIQGRHKFGLDHSGVATNKHQELWKKHLQIMKQYLPTTKQIPNTRELWTEEQINILWNFYKKSNPTFLTKQTVKGKKTSKFDKLINNIGPFVTDRMIRDTYVLTTSEYLMGEKLIDLKLKPHKFKLKKGTYLFHGSPEHNLELDKLIKPDAVSEQLGFNSFIFFGLSAAISLWYTVERFSKKAARQQENFKVISPGEFEAYLYVYRLNKDLEFQYIEDNIVYNQEGSAFKTFCNKIACLHPQFAYHSIEQLNNARGPVELDWELTIPIKKLDKTDIQLVGKYYIDVLSLLKHSTKNIDQFDPISAIDFKNLKN